MTKPKTQTKAEKRQTSTKNAKEKKLLSIVYRQINELRPYQYNARTHSDDQVAEIARSIQTVGWTIPILIDETDQIMAGHGRWEAAKRLGMEQVPTILRDDMTPDERRAYIIADNKLAENAGWDQSLLGFELQALTDAGFDTSLIGFTEIEIKKLIGSADLDPPEDWSEKGEDLPTDHECPKCGYKWSEATA